MSEPQPLFCPKCDRPLDEGERFCPVDHAITGGVHGVTRRQIEVTPRSKRHLLGVTVNDAYIVNGYLGSGGFGAVYRAEQKALGRDVALKLLMVDTVNDPQVIQRFKREARTAAALLDPNIVTLFDYGEAALSGDEDDQVLFFAMELVHGPTLRQVGKAAKGKGLGLDASLHVGINILRGLAAAHQLGVVHRDLKPGNVLIDQSKNRKYFARLFDFGISSLQGSGGHTTQVGQGGVLGTPKYMAPEQWRAKQTAPCTDIYGFGVMMAEMLLGAPPIPKMELVEMGRAHCKGPRPEVSETARGESVPKALTRFIQKCMAIDPRQRYGNAREALLALQEIERERDAAPVPEVSGMPEPGTRDPDDSSSISLSGSLDGVESIDEAPAGKRPPPPPPPPASVAPPVEEEVIKVQLEEPRRIWPWVLAAIGIALVIVGFRLVDALTSQRGDPPQQQQAVTGPEAGEPAPVTVATEDDAVVVADAAADVGPEAGPDVGPDAAADAEADATPAIEPVAVEPPKPKPARVAEKTEKSSARAAVEKPAPAAPVEAPPEPEEPAPARRAVAGMDVTPKANPTAQDLADAEADYVRGVDAQKRGAPKSAQRFFVRALRKGLSGQKAAEAQRRIKLIADRTALEASEF